MIIKGKKISILQCCCLLMYYVFARHLPASTNRVFGRVSKAIRFHLVRHIFSYCGKNVNVERGASFESGLDLRIGDNSGIGINCFVGSNTIIGNDVMMGPNCRFLTRNHAFSRTDIPINQQGFQEKKQTIIGNDCWIGRDVLATPGRIIADHSIIAAGCVLSKDFPAYSIVGGNPSRLISNRKGASALVSGD